MDSHQISRHVDLLILNIFCFLFKGFNRFHKLVEETLDAEETIDFIPKRLDSPQQYIEAISKFQNYSYDEMNVAFDLQDSTTTDLVKLIVSTHTTQLSPIDLFLSILLFFGVHIRPYEIMFLTLELLQLLQKTYICKNMAF